MGKWFGPRYQFGLSFAVSNTGGLQKFVDEVTPIKGAPNQRLVLQLLGRHYYGTGNITPFMQGGISLGYGKDIYMWDPECAATLFDCRQKSKLHFGVNFGLGLDFVLSPSTSFFVETGVNLFTEHSDIDGIENGGFGPVDLLGWNVLGFSFTPTSFVPVLVGELICPVREIETGQPTTFSASVNPNASQPVIGTWNFGDGSTATGLSASHTFARAGSYDVTFTATNGNGKGTSSKVCAVTTKDPCVKADIVSMNASTMNPDTRTSISFSSNVRGTESKQYRWDFGDGQTAASASGTHTYTQPGTYNVKLTVTNCGGTVEKTMSITVAPYEAAICREITEMNAVFFDVNSSALTAEARAKLQENLAILKECPNLNARIVGWASPGERRPQELSADRAKAVEQFYVDSGIALSRLVTTGSGVVGGLTSAKEGDSGYRRVDTIPVRN